MAVLSTIQAETGVLEGAASLISIAEFTPTNGTNNGVSADGSLDYLKINNVSVPTGTTKIVFYVKKKVANATNSEFALSYIGGTSAQYGVANQAITTEGLHAIEVTTLPNTGNNTFILDGNYMTYDRIEFKDNATTTVINADLQPSSVESLTKSGGKNKFINNGPDAIPVGAKIQFTVAIIGSAITLTPQSTKGTISPATVTDGGTITLTLTEAITNGETFGISYTNSPFKGKATTVDFNIGTVTGFVENTTNNSATSPSFVPSADLSITAVAASSTAYTFKVKNNGTDEIESGQIIRIVKSNLGAGTPSTAKGSAVMNGNNIDITLSSNLALNDEFTVVVSLTSTATANYTGTLTAEWNTNISDTTSTNNSATISYSTTTVTPTSDLAVSVVSAKSTEYSIKIKNNGADAVASGSVMKIIANSLPSGTATTSKGTIAKNGTNYDITLNSSLAVNEEFTVIVTFTTVTTSYTGTASLQWVSSINDLVASNNQISINYTESNGSGSGSGSNYSQIFAQGQPIARTTFLDWLLGFSIFGFLILIALKFIEKEKKEKKDEKRRKN